jgi:hypothetical protein
VSADVIGGGLAAVLTVMIFSYLLGANPLYRLAQHLFVGISIGYAGVVLLTTVLLPRLGQVGALLSSWLPGTAPVSNPGDVLLRVGVPMLLGVLFLGRVFRPNFPLATPALLVVTAVAAALALGGALAGTLVPQMAATMLSLNPAQVGVFGALNNAIIVLGVLVSLYYFSFGVRPDGRRGPVGALVAGAGRWLILATLGVVLGTLTVSFVAALIDRVRFLFDLAGF